VSVHSPFKELNVKEHVKTKKEMEVVHDSLPEKPFNQEELIVIWNKYVSHLKARVIDSASILNVDTPRTQRNDSTCDFLTRPMKEDLEEHGQILISQKRIKNYTLDIEITVDKSYRKNIVYRSRKSKSWWKRIHQ
jgi:hypothetical protein